MSTAQQEVITAAEVRSAETERRSLVSKMADKYGLEPNKMMATLKQTAFRGDVSNEQMAALLIVADQHNLNPWLKEIYAFPSRQGIVPVVGVDGWARITNEHPQFDGMEFSLAGEAGKEAYTCTIHRKDRSHPTSVTEYMTECKRPTDPWNSHPLRMLRHKAMIQCARLAFSFAGIYDPDEAERIIASDAIDVTPGEEGEMTRGELGASRKVSSKKLRETVDAIGAAVAANDGAAMLAVRKSLDNEEWLYIWGKMRSYERTPARKLLEAAEKADQGIGLDKWSIEFLRGAATLEALETAWRSVQDAYADNDVEVPADIETFYVDRKAELS